MAHQCAEVILADGYVLEFTSVRAAKRYARRHVTFDGRWSGSVVVRTVGRWWEFGVDDTLAIRRVSRGLTRRRY